MPGYSATPLAKKLGVKPGSRLFVRGAPPKYQELLAPLPADVVVQRAPSAKSDIVHLFVTAKSDLAAQLTKVQQKMRPNAAIWVSWPKKAAKVPTELTEDVIRSLALPLGLVDIKVCAVDDVWSGLKLVIRKELRSSQS